MGTIGQLRQDGIVRLCQRQIQGFVHLLQLLPPLDIANPGEHATLGFAELPTDLGKVQQFKGGIGKALGLGDKAIFRAEPAQLGIGDHALHKVAAVCAVRQVDQPGQGNGPFPLLMSELCQSLHDSVFPLIELGQPLGQRVQFGQGAASGIQIGVNIVAGRGLKDLPVGPFPLPQFQLLHCVQ